MNESAKRLANNLPPMGFAHFHSNGTATQRLHFKLECGQDNTAAVPRRGNRRKKRLETASPAYPDQARKWLETFVCLVRTGGRRSRTPPSPARTRPGARFIPRDACSDQASKGIESPWRLFATGIRAMGATSRLHRPRQGASVSNVTIIVKLESGKPTSANGTGVGSPHAPAEMKLGCVCGA